MEANPYKAPAENVETEHAAPPGLIRLGLSAFVAFVSGTIASISIIATIALLLAVALEGYKPLVTDVVGVSLVSTLSIWIFAASFRVIRRKRRPPA